MISFETFKRYYEGGGNEPEFYIIFSDMASEYMIIKYDDGPTFQRCGYQDGSGEYKYPSLDVLFSSDTDDGINLSRDWSKIEDIYPNGYGTFEEYCLFWKIPLEKGAEPFNYSTLFNYSSGSRF